MPARKRPAYRIMALVLRPVLRLVTRRTWRGTEHLPRGGGFIVVANHMTNLDPVLVGHYLYDNGVEPRFLAKSELFSVPVVGAALRATGQIPVDRGTDHARDALAAAQEALLAGECVAIFPEGTLTRDPSMWPMTARTGAARLALRTGVPVVPVTQWGAHRILPRYGSVPRLFPPQPVTVVADAPVDLSDLAGCAADHDTLDEATARIMAALTDRLADIRGEQPPRPYDMRRDGDPRAGRNTAAATRKAARRARRAARRARLPW